MKLRQVTVRQYAWEAGRSNGTQEGSMDVIIGILVVAVLVYVVVLLAQQT